MEDLNLGNLLDTFGQNNRFKLFPYFTICFGAFPSALKLSLPVDESKDVIVTILE